MNNILLDKRVLFLSIVVLVSLLLIYFKGINYGIEFEGGVRIPITFDKDLTPYQMEEVANIIKTRISKFGLTQVVVRPLPPRELQIELAKGDESSIHQIEKILQQQGNFEAIIDGKVGITGEDILSGSISEGSVTTVGKNMYKWEVDFAISEEGARRFAAVAYGKANKPVYMFLDRPSNAIVLIEPRHFPKGVGVADVLSAVMQLNNIEGSNLSIIIVDDWEVKKQLVESLLGNTSDREIIVSETATFVEDLKKMSNRAHLVSDKDMEFSLSYDERTGEYIIPKWKAVGLLSAPLLSEGLAKGTPSRLVSVSGSTQSIDDATNNAKEIRSILSGGRLPVNAIVGSTISIPAPLGQQFLQTSIFGAVVAFILIILFVSIRYTNPRLFIPIIVVSLAEIIILVAVLGGFGTIDFAAMAGIIAAMGVSMDAQIIITDEVFRKGISTHISKDELKEREKHAFYIITRNVVIAVIAMLPLFFSGVVEIVGFATATILGSVLGLLISRPAYAAIIENM